MQNKKASVLIYTIILTMIALILATVLLINKITFVNNQIFYNINSKLVNQINSNLALIIENEKKYNSDGSGFIDNYSGSGVNIYCRLQSDGTYFIEGDDGIKSGSDNYDDNCNSDNYLASNTGSTYFSGVSGYFEDNDNQARKELIGIVVPKQQKNIFWNNKKIEDFINSNPNNNDIFNKNLSQVSTGNLYLELNSGSILTLIEYDKNRYNSFKEIKKNKEYSGSVFGSGYIKLNGTNLELDLNSANSYNFNFTNSGYLLFLTNTGTSELISYKLTGFEKDTGSGIYLNPINDDINNTSSIKYLGYDVIIDGADIYGKILEKEVYK